MSLRRIPLLLQRNAGMGNGMISGAAAAVAVLHNGRQTNRSYRTRRSPVKILGYLRLSLFSLFASAASAATPTVLYIARVTLRI